MRIRGKFLVFTCLFVLLPLSGGTPAHSEEPKLNCRQKFVQALKNYFVGNDEPAKNTFSFAPEQLTGVKEFLSKSESGVQVAGLNEKLVKFQKLVLSRYSKTLDPEVINAFGTMRDFIMAEGGFSAEVKIYSDGNKLVVEIPNIRARSAGSLGKVSRGLDIGMAHFFATVTKGIEYRLFLQKDLSLVEIRPSKVVNRKLKNMLHEFGFKKTAELPDWGDVHGFREGMGPAAEFEMHGTVLRNPQP